MHFVSKGVADNRLDILADPIRWPAAAMINKHRDILITKPDEGGAGTLHKMFGTMTRSALPPSELCRCGRRYSSDVDPELLPQ